MHLYSYNEGSQGAKSLAESLGIRRIKHERSTFRGSPDRVVINWGASTLPPEVLRCRVLNQPTAVSRATNKLAFFEDLHRAGNIRIPAYTAARTQAQEWIRAGNVVVCRTILNGSGGRGIVIAETEDQLVQAPLYTKYVKKKDEYRIHIARDLRRDITEVIDVQKKARRLDSGPVNWRIRNLENGFIYKRQDVNPPQHVLDNSIRALQVSGLDFGAVDIIVNANEDRSYVLEINSAPGLEGTTLESYTNYFKNFL
jgi:hypothetical protein